MHQKIAPICNDIISIPNVTPTELKLVLAIIGRNGFDDGECCTVTMSKRSGLSFTSVKKNFKTLLDKRFFLNKHYKCKKRFGKINLPEIEAKYKKIICNQYTDYFEGHIVEWSIDMDSFLFKCNDSASLITVYKNERSLIAQIPTGVPIKIFYIPIFDIENNNATPSKDKFYLANRNIELIG